MKKTDEPTLEHLIKEGFEQVSLRLEALEKQVGVLDARLLRIEWTCSSPCNLGIGSYIFPVLYAGP